MIESEKKVIESLKKQLNDEENHLLYLNERVREYQVKTAALRDVIDSLENKSIEDYQSMKFMGKGEGEIKFKYEGQAKRLSLWQRLFRRK